MCKFKVRKHITWHVLAGLLHQPSCILPILVKQIPLPRGGAAPANIPAAQSPSAPSKPPAAAASAEKPQQKKKEKKQANKG